MSSKQVIVELPLNKIVPNPDNNKIFNMSRIDELASSIKDNGFKGAIEVYELGDGMYEISSGHRRYEAQKTLGKKTIPAIVSPKADDVTRAKSLIESNIHNRELSIIDKARAINYYQKNVMKDVKGENKIELMAKIFGISVTQVKYLKRILTYHPEIQDLIEKNIITSYNGLINLNKLNPDEQKVVADQLAVVSKEYKDEPIPYTRVKLIVDNAVKEKENKQRLSEINEKNEEKQPVIEEYNDTLNEEISIKSQKKSIGIPIQEGIFGEFSEGQFKQKDYGEIIYEEDDNYQVYAEEELIKGIDIIKRALNKNFRFATDTYIKELEDIIDTLKKK